MNKQKIIISVILLLTSLAAALALRNPGGKKHIETPLQKDGSSIEFGGTVFSEGDKQVVLTAPPQMDSLTAKKTEGKITSGNDSSRIAVSFDAYGTKIEHRDFRNDSRILMLSVETFPDGTKRAKAFSRNGEIKYLPPDLINRALTDKADDIADALGFIKPIATPEIIVPETTEPPDANSLQAEEPAAETASEPTEKESVEQKQEIDNSLKMTESTKTNQTIEPQPKN